jgi:hypothetical protein
LLYLLHGPLCAKARLCLQEPDVAVPEHHLPIPS